MNSFPAPSCDVAAGRVFAVMRAIELMKAELSQKVTLTSLAAVGRFSPFHFHRVFREVTGVTPARFLAALRMAEAKRLLLYSRTSVLDVSVWVGYESPGTFSTQFAQLVGVAPGCFRHLLRTFAGESVQALLSAAPPQPAVAGNTALGGGSRISLSGAAGAGGVAFGGVFAEGSVREQPGTWIAAAGQLPVCAATVPDAGEYRAYVSVVDPATDLEDALVGQEPGRYLRGVASIRPSTGTTAQQHIAVPLHSPRLTDPPLLAVTSLRWLCDQMPAGSPGALLTQRAFTPTGRERRTGPGSTTRGHRAAGCLSPSRTVTVALATATPPQRAAAR